MKNDLLYENLDTSFVNLAALVRFLRARSFAGNVRVELGEYEGEIVLTAENDLSAREFDHASGRRAEGDEALQRLLIRAREPGGNICVYRSETSAAQTLTNEDGVAESTIFAAANGEFSPKNANTSSPSKILPTSAPHAKAPDFPFEFSNNVESRAKRNQLSEADWQTFLRLLSELLGAIDETLAKNNLNFAAAFQKARAEIAGDYPFLDPNAEIFSYRRGQVEMREQANAKLLAAAINETLRRILEKLAAIPRFAEAHRETTQKILALVRKNQPLYEQFHITPQIEKTLGVR